MMFTGLVKSPAARSAEVLFHCRWQSSYAKIIKLTQLQEFRQVLQEKKDSLSVFDFYAVWCGPCKAMAPHLSKCVENYPKVSFYKIDVDESPEIAQHCQVSAMPTFVLAKNGTLLGKVVGANPAGLQKAIEENQQ